MDDKAIKEISAAAQTGGYVFFDSPVSSVCREPLITSTGWLAGSPEGVTFEVNGHPVMTLAWNARPELAELLPGVPVAGFSFRIDAYTAMRAPSRALHVVVKAANGAVIQQQFLRFLPQDLEEAQQSWLTFFLHISKTGGSSVRLEMERIASAANYDAFYMAYNAGGSVERLHPKTLASFDFVLGHFAHGVHEIARDRPSTYISVLREPRSFLESMYFYLKQMGVLQHKTIFDFLRARESLIQVDNHMTRMVSGIILPDRVTPDILAVAKQNIDRDFAFVGMTEEMPKTLQRLSEITGIDMRGAKKLNVTAPNPERDNLDREAFADETEGLVQYDRELCDYVRAKFL